MAREQCFGMILGLLITVLQIISLLFNYHLSNDKDASIDKMGMWDGFEWTWFFS
jgi:hypothetical protein